MVFRVRKWRGGWASGTKRQKHPKAAKHPRIGKMASHHPTSHVRGHCHPTFGRPSAIPTAKKKIAGFPEGIGSGHRGWRLQFQLQLSPSPRQTIQAQAIHPLEKMEADPDRKNLFDGRDESDSYTQAPKILPRQFFEKSSLPSRPTTADIFKPPSSPGCSRQV